MVKHLLAAPAGAFAGAFIGLLVQYGDLGDGGGDTEQLVRRSIIGAAAWAFGAINLSFVFELAGGRQWAWALGVAVVVGVLMGGLAGAGIVVLGFAPSFALLQASALITIPALAVWLGGSIALRQRGPVSG